MIEMRKIKRFQWWDTDYTARYNYIELERKERTATLLYM